MRRGIHSILAGLALVIGVVLAPAALASAQTPIGPDENFIGLVNGSNDNPAVYTVCPGPIWPGRTGRVAGGQTIAVAQVKDGGGYTGPFSQVEAWFVTPTPGPTPVSVGQFPTILQFTEYGVPQAIPSSIQVPCGGTGTVEFSPCPYAAPCAAVGWKPDYVMVRFINLAA